MLKRETVCLRRLGGDRATEVKFGRWLRNAKVTSAELIDTATRKVEALAHGLHVLAIQDTTELNYQAHAQRVNGLGTVGNGTDKGLFLHPMVSIDAESGDCLGVAAIYAWLRPAGGGRDYRKLPIEEKESYRWLQVAASAKARLHRAAMVTVIADRESDIYEEWTRVPDARTHVLTRACRDRVVTGGGCLYAYTDRLEVAASYRLPVPGRVGKRSAHEAAMQVRAGQVTIKRPARCTDRNAPAEVVLWVVDVRETPETVINGEAPIHWRLLTTHCIDSVAKARQVVEWYRQRWQIEQFFRVLKKQGLNIESSQVESAQGLIKLAVLSVQVAIKSMQLIAARDGRAQRCATDVFEAQELAVLEALQGQLEGNTDKQQNPHRVGELAWASWLIARLGGWKGYRSESPPGPITLLRGIQRLAGICDGWRLAKDVCID